MQASADARAVLNPQSLLSTCCVRLRHDQIATKLRATRKTAETRRCWCLAVRTSKLQSRSLNDALFQQSMSDMYASKLSIRRPLKSSADPRGNEGKSDSAFVGTHDPENRAGAVVGSETVE